MQRYRVLQTYVPPLIADWILEQSNLRETSVSVVIRDHLVAAWNRDNDHADRPGGTDPARQLVFLMNANLPDLHKLLEDTMAGPMTDPQAAKMAESVRAVFNVNAKALQLLPTEGEPFSIRNWVKGEGKEGSFLFLSARYADLTVLSQMLTLWLDTAINTLMTGRTTPDLKLWFLIDELGALHRLPSLEKGLQTARNYGGAIVTGVHAFAKLKEVYGENMAMTLGTGKAIAEKSPKVFEPELAKERNRSMDFGI